MEDTVRLELKEGVYIGEVLNGLPHGKGKMMYAYESEPFYYEGEWKHGERHGWGKIVFNDHLSIEGKWVEDAFVHGTMIDHKETYKGDFCDGEKCGYGTIRCTTGRVWRGRWKHDKRAPDDQSDPLPNAVLVDINSKIHLVTIEDWKSDVGLGFPLDCEKIRIIDTPETKEMCSILEMSLIVYTDANAKYPCSTNEFMVDLTGEILHSGCIICGNKRGRCAPLSWQDAEELFDILVETQEDANSEE